ncbi:MAG: Ig-like domain-containing protein, partial [Limisphaerales bacterium]
MNLLRCRPASAASVASAVLSLSLAWTAPMASRGQVLGIESQPQGRFRVSWPASADGVSLEESPALGPDARWTAVGVPVETVGNSRQVVLSAGGQTRFYRLVRIPSGPARLVETSPADGETDVSVHRETVFRFDESLAPETQLDVSVIEAQAAGRPLLTRVELATDRRSAALFYLEPLPAGSRVEVRFDGFRVLDSAGRAVDADLDGWPGGVRTFSFTTVNATPVGTTSVSGRVLASEKNPDGTDRPLPGVTITVDGAEQELRAVTGADGTFTLQPSPAGRFFVHVDGRTSSLSDWPDGAYYPFVGKSWEADAGRTDNLAGGDGRIYLPRVPGDALRTVSATDSTVVGFSPSILASNPDLEGVEVRVPANALYSENGTRGGRIGIAPVAPDRLPEPLPPGLNLPLVITIQTDGPANFDRPVPVRFPNLPDPVTGEILGPGAKTALWSFDHDTGRWEIAGPMTISADGRFAETDPGVGVRQPGWHGASPGGPGGGPEGPGGGGPGDDCATCDDDPPKEPPDCDFFNPFCEGNNCRKEARLLFNSVNDLVEDIGAAHLDDGAPGCALGVATSAMRAARDCSIDLEACGEWDIANPIIDGAIGSALGCIPKAGSILSSAWTFKSVIFNVAALDDCAGRQGQRAGLHAVSGGGGAAFGAQVAVIRSLLNRQIEVCEASSNLVAVWFGPAWAVAQTPSNGDSEKYRAFLQAVNEVVGPESDRRWEVTPAERAALLALPLPSLVSSADVEGLVDRLNRMATGAFRSGDPDTDAFLSAATRLESVIAARQADGWESVWDGIFRVAAVLSAFAEPAPDSSSYGTWTPGGASAGVDASLLTVPEEDPTSLEPAFPRRAHFFALQDLATGFVQRGRMTSLGQMPPQILAPNRRYRITYLDPENDRHGSALFISVQAGRRTRIPAAPLLADLGPDRDADGLGDRQEWILGSEPGAPDSDGDGVLDGAEFVSGANPLDGREVVVGVIGGADTPGNAEHVAIDGNLALVADGSEGFGVFDLSLPRSPVRVAQISIPRARVAAVSGGIALVARTQGAALLDLRLPTQPTIVTNFGATAVAAVALAPPVGYFGRASSVFIVDLATARLLPEVSAGAAVHDLAVDGDLLHVLTAADLRIFRRVGLGLEELSRTTIAGGTPPLEIGRRLFAGGGRAYVGYFEGFTILDVSDPTTPVVLVRQPRTQAAIHDLVENGSGLLAVTTSFGGAQSLAFSLYDVQTADSTTNFITSLATPGDPRSVVIHKGLAYVADSRAGLQVVHFLPRDTAGQRPTIAFGPPLADISPSLEIGSSALLTFVTGDDVQVREVEVYRDGVLLGSAGSFPFQVPITVAPPASPGRTSVVLRARALDTAGNERWTDERTVALTPDRTPPTVLLLNPPNGGEFLPGVVTSVTVGFSEPMGLGSLPGGLLLSEAGPDGTHGTADDRPIAVQIAYLSANLTAELRPATVFPVGHYRLRATTSLADAAGQTLPSEQAWTFRIPPSAVLATTPVNNSNHRPGALTAITARFSALMDAASLRSGGFALLHAGPDGQSGTADDIPVDVAALSFSAVSNRMTFNPAPALRSGRYRATLTTN